MRFHGKEIFEFEPILRNIRNNFTYEFWVKPAASHQIDEETNKGISGVSAQRYVIGAGYGGHRRFAGIGVSVGTNGVSVYEHSSNHLPATLVHVEDISDWTHIAIVYNQKIPYLYINGVFKKRGQKSLKSHVFGSGIIGGLKPYGSFVGEVRELRIWDHARTENQIKENINKNLTGHEKGLFKYVSMNDNKINWQFTSIIDNMTNPIGDSIFTSDTTPKINFPRQLRRPLVSIIIPVHNKWKYTLACLDAINRNTKNIDYEIIIADDVSNDETVNIKKYIHNITVIRDGIQRGFLKNCNNAASYAKGKYLVFLNNDTEVQSNWLKYLVDLIESDKKIGMVGSKLIYPNGKLQEAGGIIWNDVSGWNYGRTDDPEKPEYCYVKEVDYISGACIMIRSWLWNLIGGFDTRFSPAYCEDTDLAFEVRKSGYKVMYQPKSVVVHHEGISHGTNINAGIKRYQAINSKKFLTKWKSILEKEHFPNGQNAFQARDRSSKKKTILVIDHYVPQYDKDAGSRTVFQYLRLFTEMGLNVKFVGDNFLRNEPYTTELQQLGIEVLYGPWYSKNILEWIKKNSRNIHYVFLNRPHISIKYLDFLKTQTKAKILYYGHDLHYLRILREYNLFKRRDLLKASNHWKNTENQIFKKADVVYYLSQTEINEIKKQFPSIQARNIPVYVFDEFEINNSPFSGKSDLLYVGGFDHTPNVDAVLWFVQSIYPKIVQKIPNIKFYIVGSNPPNQIKRLQSKNIIVTGFVSDGELKEYYKNSRLAVVPLRYGAGVKGKVLEAMYHQVPIITTSVGAEGYDNSTSILTIADDPNVFADKVVSLYNNESLLEKIATSSLNYVKTHFSKEKAISILSKDIQL
ncbi:glycosyltransferase [Cytobacillus oceanisediminis]|uniref:glycosyltransferase n=1 Tax=Cytobacillus oceanisediminis TaxID=665099 RepID=UPI001D13BCDC|nr:glycosyltransferase [Cytobacillus oceanisediminis]MCC3646353.1 glycosyltransferase [Cytobacillus oceanisediminis]